MTTRTAIVTGGSAGIGQEIARGLVAAGHRVVIASRDPARFVGGPTGLTAAPTAAVGPPTGWAEPWPLDLADLRSVRAFAARARKELPAIDVVICNAGVWPRQRQPTAAGVELGFAVGHVGHAALVRALDPHLADGARIVTIASGLHARGRIAWDDPSLAPRAGASAGYAESRSLVAPAGAFDPLAAYAQTKLANVMFALALARRAPRLRSNAVHPGVARTALHGDRPPANAISPAAAARGPLHLALAAEHAATTGRYFDQLAARRPSPLALDRASQDRLWAITERLIG